MGAPHVHLEPGLLRCPACLTVKPLTDFFQGPSSRQGNPCRECASARSREWRRKNPEKRREHAYKNWKKRAKRNYDFVRAYKAERGCAQCGEHDPVCLDLHHVDPATKQFEIGAKTQHASIRTLLSEMQKCLVLCRNCHAKLHHGGE